MNQIDIKEIAKEQMYCDVISQRDTIIIMMAQEIENLRKTIKKMEEKKEV